MSQSAFFPNPHDYDVQLQCKTESLQQLLAGFKLPSLEVFQSPPLHYRQRAEFKIWHQDGVANYAMFPQGNKHQPQLLQDFPVACQHISSLMVPLMAAINASLVLKRKLFQIEFLSTLAGETLVTLVYHRQLDDAWVDAAKQLQQRFAIFIIGRARRQKVVLSRDYVNECFVLNDSDHGQRNFRYKQLEGCFSQPNARVCVQMLNWACEVAAGLENQPGDLLELYCGNGNFTLPLSRFFRKVLATEISKPLIKAAQDNCAANEVDNIQFVRLAAEEVTQALNREREFRRLKDIDLDSFELSTVFVDPPRSGLDQNTCRLVQKFDNILYVSCNPQTLADNLALLTQSHCIKHLALFDQFPYTEHMECGALLRKRN